MDAEDSLFTGSDSEAQDQVVMHSEDADEQWDGFPENPVREKLLPTGSEETEDLWGSLVEYLTVYAKDDMRSMLPCEVEIEA